VARAWRDVRFGNLYVTQDGLHWLFEVTVSLGGLSPGLVRVQLYAEPADGEAPAPVVMDLKGPAPGSAHGYCYTAKAPADRPIQHYTPRVLPHHPDAFVPLEDGHIRWRHG
jgi:starch phosphorylase